jgi:AcrR family transcriptional regulator
MAQPRQPVTRRRRELLQTLEALFLADGFAHLTMDDLAASLRCSKATLYALAPSKEQIVTLVVTDFFKRATAQVEARLDSAAVGPAQLVAYLDAIAEALAPASRDFIADVASFAPARAIYEANAQAAARRVRQLVTAGVDAGQFDSRIDPAFVSALVGLTIEAVQRGEVAERSGLPDAAAFAGLREVVLRAVTRQP